MKVENLLDKAQYAFQTQLNLTNELKNQALNRFKDLIIQNSQKIIKANEKDLKLAKKNKISEVLYQRLKLDEVKLRQVLKGIEGVIKLNDPCQKIVEERELDNDLVLKKVTVPIGVIGVIFESRPDVIPQVLSLVLKSSNVCILKGGIEAQNTNKAFMNVVKELNKECNFLNKDWAQLLETRKDVKEMLKFSSKLDLVIPRGSNKFVQYVMSNSKAPVLGHADGICHLYVHNEADLKLALNVVIDSKTNYPAACNALETLLIDVNIADQFIPKLVEISKMKNLVLKGCTNSCKISNEIMKVNKNDWDTEHGNLTLSLKIVKNLDEAIQHISTHGSKHTDGIITNNSKIINEFMSRVDSANVFANASTRFADGFRYGFGAEVGISTSKTHARGPVGLEGLCIYKYKLLGKGHIVEDYSGTNPKRHFKHEINS